MTIFVLLLYPEKESPNSKVASDAEKPLSQSPEGRPSCAVIGEMAAPPQSSERSSDAASDESPGKHASEDVGSPVLPVQSPAGGFLQSPGVPVRSPARGLRSPARGLRSPGLSEQSPARGLKHAGQEKVVPLQSPMKSLPSSKLDSDDDREGECPMEVESSCPMSFRLAFEDGKADGDECSSQMSFELSLSQSQDISGLVESGVAVGGGSGARDGSGGLESQGAGNEGVEKEIEGAGSQRVGGEIEMAASQEQIVGVVSQGVEGSVEGPSVEEASSRGEGKAGSQQEIGESEVPGEGRGEARAGVNMMETEVGSSEVVQVQESEEVGEVREPSGDVRGREERSHVRELLYESIRYSEEDGSPLSSSKDFSVGLTAENNQVASSKCSNSQTSEISQLTSSAGTCMLVFTQPGSLEPRGSKVELLQCSQEEPGCVGRMHRQKDAWAECSWRWS